MKKLSIRNILVPIDFSKMSIQAIETAKRLGQRFGAAIHLVHVHHWQYPADFVGPVISSGFLPKSFQEDRNKQLAEQLKSVANTAGFSPQEQTHLRTGAAPFHEICKLAQEIPADLIVMPTHGHTGLKHVLLGSTAERVVQHSPCPVFVVRQRKRKSETRRVFTTDSILVPVDFSNCSREGLQYAIGFANEFGASSFCCMPRISNTFIQVKARPSMTFPACKRLFAKLPSAKCESSCGRQALEQVKFETVFTEASPVVGYLCLCKRPRRRSDHYLDAWADRFRSMS